MARAAVHPSEGARPLGSRNAWVRTSSEPGPEIFTSGSGRSDAELGTGDDRGGVGPGPAPKPMPDGPPGAPRVRTAEIRPAQMTSTPPVSQTPRLVIGSEKGSRRSDPSS